MTQLPLLANIPGDEPKEAQIVQIITTDDPVNCLTKESYSGKNKILLAKTASDYGYKRNVWGTFHQWMSQGFIVRKGEHGVSIFCGYYERKDSNKKSPRYARVFNLGQVEAKNL